ncbi:hypothetical protein H4219_002131 [Mycoemilia scoparia]|uniref:MIR domain-containing protein n=1 Tax=Mycoemilia scoparia TaxID=417184 RepID=A0A9W8A4U6_9FUNG|nr:hypothetical protein H4219_002131 [Mycoemilia scoparia]
MILLKQGLVIFAAFSIVAQSWWSNSSDQEKEDASPEYEKGWEFVTWGSTIQLRHLATKTRLTVPQVNYGSGSGQLAVTSKADSSDTQNFWMVSPENGIAFMGRYD